MLRALELCLFLYKKGSRQRDPPPQIRTGPFSKGRHLRWVILATQAMFLCVYSYSFVHTTRAMLSPVFSGHPFEMIALFSLLHIDDRPIPNRSDKGKCALPRVAGSGVFSVSSRSGGTHFQGSIPWLRCFGNSFSWSYLASLPYI